MQGERPVANDQPSGILEVSDLMEQFPSLIPSTDLPLKQGVLQVEAAIQPCGEPMPWPSVSTRFTGERCAARPNGRSLGARDQTVLSKEVIHRRADQRASKYPDRSRSRASGSTRIHQHDPRCQSAEFWIQGKTEKVSVIYGRKYDVAVVVAADRVNVVMDAIRHHHASSTWRIGAYKDCI